MGGGFHSRHYRTLWFNSAGSEEAEPELRRRGRQTHAASSSNSFCLVIWLRLRDCGLMKRRQEKWKIHVPLNTITSVNAAACLRQPFLMDCALLFSLFFFFLFLLFVALSERRGFTSARPRRNLGIKTSDESAMESKRSALFPLSCFYFAQRSTQHRIPTLSWRNKEQQVGNWSTSWRILFPTCSSIKRNISRSIYWDVFHSALLLLAALSSSSLCKSTRNMKSRMAPPLWRHGYWQLPPKQQLNEDQ